MRKWGVDEDGNRLWENIRVKKELHTYLKDRKQEGESFNECLHRLLGLKKKTVVVWKYPKLQPEREA